MKLTIALWTLTLLLIVSEYASGFPKSKDEVKQVSEDSGLDEIRKHVVFNLYTRENSESSENMHVLSMVQQGARPRYFNPEWPVRICVHGWGANESNLKSIRTAFLEEGDYNVIMMDWSKLVPEWSFMTYPKARTMVTPLGRWLAYFMDVLVDTYKLSVKDFHVIGHSLGAHVAAEAGRNAAEEKVGRITGLDPTHLLFKGTSDKIGHDAAEFVDIIHTCGKFFGLWEAVGHADFYPNDGLVFQPGCNLNPLCSHFRAVEYFAESITNKSGFLSQPYENSPRGDFATNKEVARMGYFTDVSTRGLYSLETASHPPFAGPPSSSFIKSDEHGEIEIATPHGYWLQMQ